MTELKGLVFVATLGWSGVWWNGEQVSSGSQEQAISVYQEEVLYGTWELGDVVKGQNVLGLEVGRAWWGHFLYGNPAVRVVVVFEGVCDGFVVQVQKSVNASMVERSDGPRVFNDLFQGEYFDAKIAESQIGWNTPNFTQRWPSAQVWQPGDGGQPGDLLVPMSMPTVQPQKTPIQVASFWRLEDGGVVASFSEAMTGWTRVKLRGQGGMQVILAHTELLGPDHNLFNQYMCPNPNVCVNQTDKYTLLGGTFCAVDSGCGALEKGEEMYEPALTFHGFQHVRLSSSAAASKPYTPGPIQLPFELPGNVMVSSVQGIASNTALEVRANFSSSHPMLNSIFQLVQRTFVANLQGHQLSCPQREKLAWTGDTRATMPAMVDFFGRPIGAFWSNYLRQLTSATLMSGSSILPQAPKGAVPDTTPHLQFQTHGDWPSANGSTPGAMEGWTPVLPATARLMVERFGDVQAATQAVPAIEAYLDLLYSQETAPNAFTTYRYSAWANPYSHEAAKCIGPLLADAFYSSAVADAAFVLSTTAQPRASNTTKKAAAILQTFNSTFWNASRNAYGSCSLFDQDANARALSMNAPGNYSQKTTTFKALERSVQATSNHVGVGFQGVEVLFTELAKQNSNLPLDIRDAGNQTAQNDQAISLSHPMFGSVAHFLLADLAGISYSNGLLHIHPKLLTHPSLTSINATIDTPFGFASISWSTSKKYNNLLLTLTISRPVGLNILLTLPSTSNLPPKSTHIGPGLKTIKVTQNLHT